MYPPQLAS
jgi:hypothetical protein